jgi:anti-sigma B factor antagonist
MQLEEMSFGDVLVLSLLDPRVDKRQGQDLKQAVADRIERGHRRIVLDLARVSFIDSTGLGAIISSLKLLGPTGELVLCGARESVSSLLRLTRLDKVLRSFPTSDDALKSLGSPQPAALS